MATAGDGPGAGPERAWCAPLPATGTVVLRGEEAHHLARVRRVRVGDAVVLFDGAGATVLARLVSTTPHEAVLEVTGPYPDREPRRALTVAVSLPAAGRADDLVADLAEMGVTRLVPIVCERSAPDAGERGERRRERFDRLVREAAKVNGRSRLLRVDPARPFSEALEGTGWGRAFLLDPDPALPSLAAVIPVAEPAIALIVGPEGGFSPGERARAARSGAVLASLGPCALRVETAARAAAAVALCL